MDPWLIQPDAYPAQGTRADQLRFLLRFALLAPSSHNSQPWKYSIREDRVDIHLDRARWLRVADPDQRELHISIGCTLENLLVAAEHFHFATDIEFFPDGPDSDLAVRVQLETRPREPSFRPPGLLAMIPTRHTNHQPYEVRQVPDNALERLRHSVNEEGVVLYLSDDARFRQRAAELVMRGDLAQWSDPEFRRELAGWIARGVFGTPWLTSQLYALTVRRVNIGRTQATRDASLIADSAVIGVLRSLRSDPEYWILVGQAFERLALVAASIGLWTQPMSQLLEVPAVKAEFLQLLPPSRLMPQHAFRLGFGPPERRHTPRRPLEEMLLT